MCSKENRHGALGVRAPLYISSHPAASAGTLTHRVHGKGALDAHNTWHIYNGNDAHCTVPFKGPGARYSFVFFTLKVLPLNPKP